MKLKPAKRIGKRRVKYYGLKKLNQAYRQGKISLRTYLERCKNINR